MNGVEDNAKRFALSSSGTSLAKTESHQNIYLTILISTATII